MSGHLNHLNRHSWKVVVAPHFFTFCAQRTLYQYTFLERGIDDKVHCNLQWICYFVWNIVRIVTIKENRTRHNALLLLLFRIGTNNADSLNSVDCECCLTHGSGIYIPKWVNLQKSAHCLKFIFVQRKHENMSPCTDCKVNSSYERVIVSCAETPSWTLARGVSM